MQELSIKPWSRKWTDATIQQWACSVGAVRAPVVREEADFGLPSRKDALQACLLRGVTHVIQHPFQQLWKEVRKLFFFAVTRKKKLNRIDVHSISVCKRTTTFSSVPPKSALYHLNIWLSRTSLFPESTTQASSFSRKASAAVRSWLSISWRGSVNNDFWLIKLPVLPYMFYNACQSR